MDNNQNSNVNPSMTSLFTITDEFSLGLVKQYNKQEISEIEQRFNVEIYINEVYGQVQITNKSTQQLDKDSSDLFFSQIGYRINELTIMQSNKLKEGSIDCNREFFLKIQKKLKQKYNEENKKVDYDISLSANEFSGNSISEYSYSPLVIKSINIKGKFVVKICKIEQPEYLNFDKIDVIVLNMTNSGLFLDEFGYQLYKSNKQINSLIKSIKPNLNQSQFIDEKIFTYGKNNVSLMIQLEDTEDNCLKRLISILNKAKEQQFSKKGNLKIYIGWRSCCEIKYFNELYQYLEKLESQRTYLQFPTEIYLITDEGSENQVVEIAKSVQFNQTNRGQIEVKEEINWYINNVKYPRFVDQQQSMQGILLNKDVSQILDTAISLNIPEIYVAMKVEDKEKQFFQTSAQLGLKPDLVDRHKLNLKTLKETNLSQSQTNQIMNQCDFYYYFHPFDEQFVEYQENVQKVIRSYIELGIHELRLEKDSCSQEVITPIFQINVKNLTMTQLGGKNSMVHMKKQTKKIQVINNQQKQPLEDEMKNNIADFLKSDQAEKVLNTLTKKSKPVIQLRARPDTYNFIESFINQLKNKYFVSHQLLCSKNINPKQRQDIDDLCLKENFDITFIENNALIYGFKKTINRLLPTIMNNICENKFAEEAVHTNPNHWEGQDKNYKVISLDLQSEEAIKCIQLFNQSQKYKILNKGCATEKFLFHGSGANVDPKTIYSAFEEAFDFRNNDQGEYGRGAHFFERAIDSEAFAYKSGQVKILFLAQVLIGKYYESPSNTKYTKPPLLPGSQDIRYDSIRSSRSEGNNTYVVYHNSKAYPSYLIEYSS